MKKKENCLSVIRISLFILLILFAPLKIKAAEKVDSGVAIARVQKVNEWTSGDRAYVQYQLSYQNMQTKTINSWVFSISAYSGTRIENYWNTEASLKKNTIRLKNMDYNGKLKKKEYAKDIGFILSYSGKKRIATGKFQVDEKGLLTKQTSKAAENQPKVTATPTPSAKKPTPTPSAPTPTSTEDAQKIPASTKTPYQKYGKLRVKNGKLTDKNGKAVQLKGVSTHGIAWYPDYVNKKAFQTLRDDWGINTIRLAMYTDEYGGYCSGGDQGDLEALIDKGVKACKDLGMYCIIDWHVLNDQDPNKYKKQSLSFFKKMTKKYAKYGNVIYEICNEPNGNTDWNSIKKYADQVIPVIHKNVPDAVILVGTPTWSQQIDLPASNPVKDQKNVMYVFHFYAGTHKGDMRERLERAVEAGTPVFISEFGICDASGNGGEDIAEANRWKKTINRLGISYVGWNLSNKQESCALIRSDCTKKSGWSEKNLSSWGKWLRKMSRGK